MIIHVMLTGMSINIIEITGCPRQYAIFYQYVTGTEPYQILLINDSFSSQKFNEHNLYQ